MELKQENPAPRLPLEMKVEYRRSYARQREAGHLVNISITGAFLATEYKEFKPNDKIVVNFSVSGRQRKINASVVWKNDRGCGIRFNPFNNRDVQIVDDLMYYVETKRKTGRDVLEGIFERVS